MRGRKKELHDSIVRPMRANGKPNWAVRGAILYRDFVINATGYLCRRKAHGFGTYRIVPARVDVMPMPTDKPL